MRLATIKWNGAEIAGIVTERGILPIKAVNARKGTTWEETLFAMIETGQLKDLTDWYNAGGKAELASIPGAVPYDADGDLAECRIIGPVGFSMEPLVNPVVDLKKHPEKG